MNVRTLTPSQLLAAIENADKANGEANRALISAGRGYERYSDIIKQSDALSVRLLEASELQSVLRAEKNRRYTYHGSLRRTP